MKITRNTVHDIQRLYRDQLDKTKGAGEDFRKVMDGSAGKPQAPARSVFTPPSGVNPLNPVFTGKPVTQIDPADTMAFAAQVVAGEPDVRAERVDALKALIDRGQYNIPAGDVANRLLESGVLTAPWEA